jgi:hypothetical protein
MASVNKVHLDEEKLLELYVNQGLGICGVSAAMSAPRSTVRARLLGLGVLRSREQGRRLASSAGRFGAHLRGKHRHFHEQWRLNISASARARADRNARGVSLKPSGYLEYTRGEHKGRAVHVVLMETHIGRRLEPNEVVHHIDHNRANNDLSNLQLMTRSEHSALHGKEFSTQRKRAPNGQFE